MNDRIQRFGVVMNSLSRQKKYEIMQTTAFKVILARRINMKWCEDYENTFARIYSDWAAETFEKCASINFGNLTELEL